LGEDVYTKVAGGLNLVNLKVWNKAAVLKMCWDIEKKQDRLWIKWIHSYYIKGQHMEALRFLLKLVGWLKKFLEQRITYMYCIMLLMAREAR